MALDAGTRAAEGDGITKGGFFLGKGVPMLPSMERIVMVNGGCNTKCYVREPRCVGALCMETMETPIIPEMSRVPLSQREAVYHAVVEQGKIGWEQGFRGYLSKHWAHAITLNTELDEKSPSKRKEIGDTWARKMILQLWKYADEMWEHRNNKLHNTKLDACRKMKSVAVDLEIETLYGKVDEIDAEDQWRFNMPLVVRLNKSLWSKRRWLSLTKMLVDKSMMGIHGGQWEITEFFKRSTNNSDQTHSMGGEKEVTWPSLPRFFRQMMLE